MEMTTLVKTVMCLLAGMLSLCHADKVTVVCADLVGAGGVGIRVWPTLKASPDRRSRTTQFRLLQVNWDAERLLEGDWVGLFDEDPRPPHLRPPHSQAGAISTRDWRTPRPLFWDTPYATLGTITTNYSQGRVELSVLARGGCVGPFVGFVRNGVCVAAECLASHPTWLYDHRAVLGSRSLRSLVIPGTHNAGSYSLADDNDVVASWVVCQDEDIVSQLLYGIRYIDLRVGYYPDTQELLWVNHDLVRWRPLQDVLDGVRGFLSLSPDPVIIDVHRTPVGFKLPEAMELLLSLVNATLGKDLVPSRHGSHVTLDDLWQMGKRVVFTINEATVSDYTPWVWPPLPQAWANAQLLDDLWAFLDSQMRKRFESPRLWAAMAHLTPSLWDLLFRSHVGVRGMADRVSFSITRWLRQRWGHMANIVASDFFRGNDIINIAIRTNLALSMCRPSDPSRHPYTLRWTAELTLRPGSTSTTVPPFVRRMYPSGVLWSKTGVRHIHYPDIPVDPSISMVFASIPTRIPSMAPGVTYQQDAGRSWSEVFHYPIDASPLPPESVTSRPIPTTPPQPSTTTLWPSRESIVSITAEWDDVNYEFPDFRLFDILYGLQPENTTQDTLIATMSTQIPYSDDDLSDFSSSLGGYEFTNNTNDNDHAGSTEIRHGISTNNFPAVYVPHQINDSTLSPQNENETFNNFMILFSANGQSNDSFFQPTSDIETDNDSALLINDSKSDASFGITTFTTTTDNNNNITAAFNPGSSPRITSEQDIFLRSSGSTVSPNNYYNTRETTFSPKGSFYRAFSSMPPATNNTHDHITKMTNEERLNNTHFQLAHHVVVPNVSAILQDSDYIENMEDGSSYKIMVNVTSELNVHNYQNFSNTLQTLSHNQKMELESNKSDSLEERPESTLVGTQQFNRSTSVLAASEIQPIVSTPKTVPTFSTVRRLNAPVKAANTVSTPPVMQFVSIFEQSRTSTHKLNTVLSTEPTYMTSPTQSSSLTSKTQYVSSALPLQPNTQLIQDWSGKSTSARVQQQQQPVTPVTAALLVTDLIAYKSSSQVT